MVALSWEILERAAVELDSLTVVEVMGLHCSRALWHAQESLRK